MSKLKFIEPLLFYKMWGGTNIENKYNIVSNPDSSIPLGEIWAVSGHHTGDNKFIEGSSVNELYHVEYSKFGLNNVPDFDFPIQIRVVDAKEKLSVQVHSQTYEVKNEAWYVLDAEPNCQFIYGTTATNISEINEAINNQKINEKLNYINVQAGDFLFVPAGMIHAIGGGCTLVEIAECSDTTYRLYDYNRIDQEGNLRPLHIEQSLENILIDNQFKTMSYVIDYNIGYQQTKYIDCEHFTVLKINVLSNENINIDKIHDYYACFITKGSGEIDGQAIKPGDSFLILNDVNSFVASGDFELIIAFRRDK